MSIERTTDSLRSEVFGTLLDSSEVTEVVNRITRGERVLVISGLASTARALVLVALQDRLTKRLVYVTRSDHDVEEFQNEVQFFFSALHGEFAVESMIQVLPALETDPYDGDIPTCRGP